MSYDFYKMNQCATVFVTVTNNPGNIGEHNKEALMSSSENTCVCLEYVKLDAS